MASSHMPSKNLTIKRGDTSLLKEKMSLNVKIYTSGEKMKMWLLSSGIKTQITMKFPSISQTNSKNWLRITMTLKSVSTNLLLRETVLLWANANLRETGLLWANAKENLLER